MRPTISRNGFCRVMKELADFLKRKGIAELEAAQLLELPICSIAFRHTDKMVDSIIDLLEEALEDEEHLITDFIYEFPSSSEKFDLNLKLRCGSEYEFAYKDIGSLYDYLIARAAQKGDDEEARRFRSELCKKYGIACC